MQKRSSLGRALLLIVVGIFLLSVIVVFGFLNSGLWERIVAYHDLLTDREWVRGFVERSPWSAAGILVGLQIGQVLLAPIPGELTGFIGGYLFGATGGFLLSTLGLTIGSLINFVIGRFLGERVVRKLVPCETYEKYNQMVQFRGILYIFIFFLIPGFPKDYLCMFLGLTTLPLRVFLVVSTVGRAPGTLALSLQGASVFRRDYLLFLIITAISLVLAGLAFLYRDALYRWMANHHRQRVCPPPGGGA
ncbi:MAG: VTT domain-containing protein [Desulfobacterales bacterium]